MSYNTVGLAKALGEARTLKGHKQEGEKLRELLDKPNFCNELGKIGRDGTSGWSSMFEAVLKGLKDERRANLLEHVEPLRKLIDTANKWDVQFECQMVVTFIEGAVERVLSSPFSAVSSLYWSMLNSLCGNDTYFRLMGYEKASTLASTLISCSWDALLSGSRNGAPSAPACARLGAAESQQQAVFAARLLCAVMFNFHFTLPTEALLATTKKFVELLGAEGNDARLPQLWMAINTMLRRQAMEHGQVVWDEFITSRPLLEFVAHALRSSGKPELIHELVQFARLVLRLSCLLVSSPPALLVKAVGSLVDQELEEGGSTWRKPIAAQLLRCGGAPADCYPALCLADLASDLLLQGRHTLSPYSATESSSSKRARLDPTSMHPPWLLALLPLSDSDGITSADSPTLWCRLLLLSSTLRRLRHRLPCHSVELAVRSLLPLASTYLDDDNSQLYALLALSCVLEASSSAVSLSSLWPQVWDALWPAQRSPSLPEGGTRACANELRERLLLRLLEQGRVPSTTVCAAARDILSAGGAACCFGDATNAAGGRPLPSTPSGRCALFLGVVTHARHAGDASTCEWSVELIVRSASGATSPPVLSDASLSLRPSTHALSPHADAFAAAHHAFQLHCELPLIAAGASPHAHLPRPPRRAAHLAGAHAGLPQLSGCALAGSEQSPDGPRDDDRHATPGLDEHAWSLVHALSIAASHAAESMRAFVESELLQMAAAGRQLSDEAREWTHSWAASSDLVDADRVPSTSFAGLAQQTDMASTVAALCKACGQMVALLRADDASISLRTQQFEPQLRRLCLAATLLADIGAARAGVAGSKGAAEVSEEETRLADDLASLSPRVFDVLERCKSERTLAFVPLLLRALLDASKGSEASGARTTAQERCARLLQLLASRVLKRVVSLIKASHEASFCSSDEMDDFASRPPDGERRCWLIGLEVACEAELMHGDVLPRVEELLELKKYLGYMTAHPEVAAEVCAAILSYPHEQLQQMAMYLIKGVEKAAIHARGLRLSLSLTCRAMELSAFRSSLRSDTAATASLLKNATGTAELELLLKHAQSVLSNAHDSLAHLTLSDYILICHASVGYLELVAREGLREDADFRSKLLKVLLQCLVGGREDFRDDTARFDGGSHHGGAPLRLQGAVLPFLPQALFSLCPPLSLLQLLLKSKMLTETAKTKHAIVSSTMTAVAIISCSSFGTPQMLFHLCNINKTSVEIGCLLFSTLQRRLSAVGGLDFLLRLHLADVIEKWVESANKLHEFPFHWLAVMPAASAHPGACNNEAFKLFVRDHMLAIVPVLSVVSATAKHVDVLARLALEQCARLLHSKPYAPVYPADCSRVCELVGPCHVEIIGRWLPTRWRSGPEASRKWDAIVCELETHLAEVGAPATSAGEPRHPHPCFLHALQSEADGILLSMLSYAVDEASRAACEHVTGHSINELVKAIEFLASKSRPGFRPADLLISPCFRIFELLMLLHFNLRTIIRQGAPSDVHRLSMLVVLELLIKTEGEALLLSPLISPPSIETFNFPIVTKTLLHIATSLLDACDGKTSEVRRCCHVLRDVLNVVLKSSPKKCGISANAHEEMVCNHVTHLLSALFPVIRAGSEDALQLLKLIGGSQDLPPRVRMQLQLLIPAVASGLQPVGLDFSAFDISLADTLIHFGNQLSETNGRRNLLLPLLQSLLSRLQEARASGELQSKYIEAAGDAMESHPLSRAVHSVARSLQKLCRSDCSKELQILIAECLAVLVSCGLSARITAHAQVAAPFTSSHNIDDAYALVLHDALVLVLTQMHACLTDSDEMVMLMAVRALREIMSRGTQELSKALETLKKTSPLTHIELLVFKDAREKDAFSSVSAVATAASAALLQAKSDAARRAMDITSPDMWKIGNRSLDEWICNLACALLSAEEEQLNTANQSAGIKGARSELKGADLKSCRLLATRRPAVAHACLFPALLNLLERERQTTGERKLLEKEAEAADHPGLSDILEEASGMAAIEPGPFERGLVIVLNQCYYDALDNGQDHSEKHLHAIGVLVTFVVQLYAQVKIELLGLNLTSVAKAAYFAGQPLSALMLLEIGSEESAELRPDTVLQDRERAQLLLDVLAALPAPDCAQGVQPPAADGAMGTLQSMQLRNDYAGCLALIDAIQESAIRTRSATLSMLQLSRIRALRNLGCEQLCAVALGQHMDATRGNAIIVDDVALVEACAESAWRLGRWQSVCGKGEVREGASLQSSGESFHRMLLAGLRAIAHGRISGAQLALRDCACSLVSELGRAGDEGGKRAVTAMVRMRMCADVAELARTLDTGWSSAAMVVSRLTATGEHLEQWPMLESALLTSTGDDFETLEPVLALHHTLLRLACPPGLVHGLLHIAGSARRAERLPFSASFIAMADQLTNSELCFNVQWERAQLWHMEGLQGNHAARREAFKAANMLITKCAAKNLLPASELAYICWQTATWLASEPGADSAQVRQLFEKASSLCNGVPCAEASEMHHAFAVWLESQHRACLHDQRSPAELCQQQASEDAARELKLLCGDTSSSDSGRKSTLQEIIARHKQKVKSHHERKLELASLALRQHAACARKGGSHDQESLFGMVGLWLQYRCQQDDLKAEDEAGSVPSYVSDPLQAVKELASVPSYKFLPLISQLACYLGSQGSTDQSFQQALQKLLLRVARSHLHVVLPHLLALAHGNRFSPSEQKVTANDEQLKMARKLLVQLQECKEKADRELQECKEKADRVINSTQLLFDFYLQVAWVDINECKNLKKTGTGNPTLSALLKNSKAIIEFDLDSGEKLLDRVQNKREAQHAAVLTQEFNIEGVGVNQVEAATVASFSPPMASFRRRAEPQCGFAGGITLPRILRCWGSDNREYKQLVKGKDDLRGDAVMQQCFGLVNQLLRRDNASRQRGLRMRTYRVVPIAPTAGVLQWVGQTLPMSHYLFGMDHNNKDIGAHARLRRDDMSFSECKQIMSDASNMAKHNNEPKYRLEQYLKCTKAFKPVFHHFFLERWPQPAAWFTRRLSYANSLATGSMVGYIVGLGDRHLSNILIDEDTAELVHIDLGIAFEAGKLLTVPEMVPFRLTRDLEDGLGVCGVEGVMRSRAEQTLRVLRENSNALLTVLQVFVRNPLYNWMQDPTRDSRRQVSGLSTKKENPNQQQKPNHDVERALLRIQQKLAGHVHGNTLSVEGQVRLLLDEARDPENLSRMFHGWAAWV